MLAKDAKRELAILIRTFAECMNADRGSEEEREIAYKFNAMLDEYLEKHKDDSVATIALNLNGLGVPYDEALRDVLYVRQLGVGGTP